MLLCLDETPGCFICAPDVPGGVFVSGLPSHIGIICFFLLFLPVFLGIAVDFHSQFKLRYSDLEEQE